MSRVKKWKLWFSITLPSLFVMLSQSLMKDRTELNTMPLWVVQLIVFFLTASAAILIVDWIFTFASVRRFFGNSYNVEGFWIIRTEFKEEANDNLLYKLGILRLMYVGSELRLKAVTTRLDNYHKRLLVHSEVAFVSDNPEKAYYLNYFSYPIQGQDMHHGLAFAEFSFPDTDTMHMQGKILLETEGKLRTQTASKISHRNVRRLRKKLGRPDWMIKVLENNGDVELALAPTNNSSE
ncbi:MAG: hypothetical protein RIC35_02555 [Marinoscillum sp.]